MQWEHCGRRCFGITKSKSLFRGDVAFTGDTGVIAPGLCDGAKLLCAECTDLAGDSDRHLSWEKLRKLRLPPLMLGHLGSEARRGLVAAPGLTICDDLDSVEL